MIPPEPLKRESLPKDTVALAKFLIGKLVVREFLDGFASGRIVETEAYLTNDAASHSYRGPTPRNKVMFSAPGYAYIYLSYGVSYMLNVSGGEEGIGEGVLIRAAEPVSGIEIMRRLRGDVPIRDLMRGPGRLAKALSINLSQNGVDLCRKGPLLLVQGEKPVGEVGVSVRIGINRDAHRLLRFFERGSPFVSGPAFLNKSIASES